MDAQTREITDTIYDTLMKNVGMSKFHVEFDISKVETCEVEAGKGLITFVYAGRVFELQLKEVE
ncbi:hypothetical protein LCGC14_0872670 [marine sediment metagenome]|uniref:Uncharacterized protein n=1 Tax=marine sediment metagenome TaxID=412755 RepID=A0A0F9P955_9ZZZZ